MKMRKHHIAAMTLGTALLGFGLVASSAASQAQGNEPNYDASVKVGNANEGENGEAVALSSLAKIDVSQAMAAALGQVPGAVLKVSLDNENGNVVYSIEIKTANDQVRDVKIDAGNAKILSTDGGGGENGENSNEGGSSEN